MDIRLDFITNIDPEHVAKMTQYRQLMIQIDELLQTFSAEAQKKDLPAADRCVSLARTHNEQTLMYGIKSLCILGEVKPEA